MRIKTIQYQFVDALWALGVIALLIYPVINIGAQYSNGTKNSVIQHLSAIFEIYAC